MSMSATLVGTAASLAENSRIDDGVAATIAECAATIAVRAATISECAATIVECAVTIAEHAAVHFRVCRELFHAGPHHLQPDFGQSSREIGQLSL